MTITEFNHPQSGLQLIHKIYDESGRLVKTHISDGYSTDSKKKFALIVRRELYKNGVTPTGEFTLDFSFAVSIDRLKKSYNYKAYCKTNTYDFQILNP